MSGKPDKQPLEQHYANQRMQSIARGEKLLKAYRNKEWKKTVKYCVTPPVTPKQD